MRQSKLRPVLTFLRSNKNHMWRPEQHDGVVCRSLSRICTNTNTELIHPWDWSRVWNISHEFFTRSLDIHPETSSFISCFPSFLTEWSCFQTELWNTLQLIACSKHTQTLLCSICKQIWLPDAATAAVSLSHGKLFQLLSCQTNKKKTKKQILHSQFS